MTTVDIDVLDEIDEIDAPEVFPLATAEQQALERCEAVIGQGVETFLQVGAALSEIQQGKLYRVHYDTFEEYCRDRWDIGRARAYQLISSSKVTAELSTMVDKPPKNEREAREIAKSAPADRPAVIARADELAGDQPRTARHIEAAAAEISAPDLPLEFSVVQRRLATHGVTLSYKDGMFTTFMDGKATGISTPTWNNVTDRLERLDAEPIDAPDHGLSDRQAHLLKEARDAGRIERARSLIEHGEHAAARTVLDQIEVSTRAADQLRATIPAGRKIELALHPDDCAALLKEARMFSGSELTKRLPAIGQVLVLLVEAIKGGV